MSEEQNTKVLKDYSEEVKQSVPPLIEQAKANPGALFSVLSQLHALEKKTRLAADAKSTNEIAMNIIKLCADLKEWKALMQQAQELVKKRAQLQKVIENIVKECVKYIVDLDQGIRRSYIECVREIAAGRMFVELERARLTNQLADMDEAEGNIAHAAEIMQDVQVETIGSMEALEKGQFLLNQLRLCLLRKDYIRSEIVIKKLDPKTLNEEKLAPLKIRFYELKSAFDIHFANYLAVSQSYLEMYKSHQLLPDKEHRLSVLRRAIVFTMLAPHDHEQNEQLQRLAHPVDREQEKDLEDLPEFKYLLEQIAGRELVTWPLPEKVVASLKAEAIFQDNAELVSLRPSGSAAQSMADEPKNSIVPTGDSVLAKDSAEQRWKDFHKRIVQLNLRIISSNYSRIRGARLAQLLQLDANACEEYLSEMVSSKQIYAKIDRPSDLIVFSKPQSSNEKLSAWSSDLSKVLGLIDKATHLINKENMIYKIK